MHTSSEVLGDPPTPSIMGIRFDAASETEVVRHVFGELDQGRGGWIVTPNVEIMRRCTSDADLHDLVSSASIRLVDGAPVEWAARLAGRPPGRVPGASLVWSLSRESARRGRTVLLWGGGPGLPSELPNDSRPRTPDLMSSTISRPSGSRGMPKRRRLSPCDCRIGRRHRPGRARVSQAGALDAGPAGRFLRSGCSAAEPASTSQPASCPGRHGGCKWLDWNGATDWPSSPDGSGAGTWSTTYLSRSVCSPGLRRSAPKAVGPPPDRRSSRRIRWPSHPPSTWTSLRR